MKNEGVLVQSNFKSSRDGAMHNVYGYDEDSYDTGLSILESRIARLAALEQQITAGANVAAALPLAPQQPPAIPAAPPAPASPPSWGQPQPASGHSFAQAATPTCQHGQRTPVSKVGAKGPWKAWMCPQDKRTGTQCEPQWVKQGSPEWNTFPA